MSDRSREQWRDGHPRGGNSVPRWVGQFYVLVSGEVDDKLIGTWWDKSAAQRWTDTFRNRFPQLMAVVIELEFKDWYSRDKRNVEDVINDL